MNVQVLYIHTYQWQLQINGTNFFIIRFCHKLCTKFICTQSIYFYPNCIATWLLFLQVCLSKATNPMFPTQHKKEISSPFACP